MKIAQFPLTRIALSFILGILSYKVYQPTPAILFLLLFFGFVAFGFFLFRANEKYLYRFWFGIFTVVISFLIGISTSIVHKETFAKNHYTKYISNDSTSLLMELVVTEKLKSSPKYNRFIAEVKSLEEKESSGKVILNIPQTTSKIQINNGTEVFLKGFLIKNQPPYNPNQFDYGKYLENQEIYAQVYALDKKIVLKKTPDNFRWSFSNLRDKITRNLEHSSIKKEELNVLIALILGQKQDISPEILKDYQYAGAIHILSVSGLHVGYIVLFVSFFLKRLKNTRKNSFLKVIITLVALWSFGILAGLSASIVRSVTMFSFVAVGLHLRRVVNTFYTLLVSMFVILLFKPSFLYDVGFQLSYLALFFILWLQPILSNFWSPKNKLLKMFWDITTVTWAAQIGTMPLSIYYFHQLPCLFYFTNIIVLPMIGVLMATGIFVVAIAAFSIVPFYIIKPLEFLIHLLNQTIHYVASLEDFVFKNIPTTIEVLWVSYVTIIVLGMWLQKPTSKKLKLLLFGIICFQGMYVFEKYKAENLNELLVLHSKKTIIIERKQREVTVYSQDSILENISKNSTIQSFLSNSFCELKETKSLKNLLFFKNKKIAIIDQSGVYLEDAKPDIVIIKDSPKLNLKRMLMHWKPQQVVVDGSNYKNYIKLWKKTCTEEKIPFHNTNEKGFYKL